MLSGAKHLQWFLMDRKYRFCAQFILSQNYRPFAPLRVTAKDSE